MLFSRISALLEEKPAAAHVPSSPFSRVVPKPRGDPLEKRTRSGQRRRTCSQQNRVSEVEPSRAGSGSSDSGEFVSSFDSFEPPR